VLVKELEKAGLPTVHVCSIVSVAQMIGSNRIVQARSIVHPLGDPDLNPESERLMRRAVIEKALNELKEK